MLRDGIRASIGNPLYSLSAFIIFYPPNRKEQCVVVFAFVRQAAAHRAVACRSLSLGR